MLVKALRGVGLAERRRVALVILLCLLQDELDALLLLPDHQWVAIGSFDRALLIRLERVVLLFSVCGWRSHFRRLVEQLPDGRILLRHLRLALKCFSRLGNFWRLSSRREGGGALRDATLHDCVAHVARGVRGGGPVLSPDSVSVQAPLPFLPQRQHLLLANENGVDPLSAALLYFVECLRRLRLPARVRLLWVGHVLCAQVPLAST